MLRGRSTFLLQSTMTDPLPPSDQPTLPPQPGDAPTYFGPSTPVPPSATTPRADHVEPTARASMLAPIQNDLPVSRAGWEDPAYRPPDAAAAADVSGGTGADLDVAPPGINCRRCGYLLDGLRADRQCPECGAPVMASLQGNLLRFAAVDYLRKLHIGLILAQVASLAGVVMLFGMLLVTTPILKVIGLPGVGAFFGRHSTASLFDAASVVLAIISLIGWWMVSSPDPSLVDKDRATSTRRVLRTLVSIELAVSIIVFALSHVLPALMTGAVTVVAVELTNSSLGIVLWLVRFELSLLYLKALALRAPDLKLHHSAGRLMWLAPLVTVLLCGFGFIFAFVAYVVLLEHARALVKSNLDFATTRERAV